MADGRWYARSVQVNAREIRMLAESGARIEYFDKAEDDLRRCQRDHTINSVDVRFTLQVGQIELLNYHGSWPGYECEGLTRDGERIVLELEVIESPVEVWLRVSRIRLFAED